MRKRLNERGEDDSRSDESVDQLPSWARTSCTARFRSRSDAPWIESFFSANCGARTASRECTAGGVSTHLLRVLNPRLMP